MDIVVIGSGIVGLSTAHCLKQAGHRITVIANSPIRTQQSAGVGRIFRISHPHNLQLQTHAQQAKEAWVQWEHAAGVRFLYETGLYMTPAPPSIHQQPNNILSSNVLNDTNTAHHAILAIPTDVDYEAGAAVIDTQAVNDYLTQDMTITDDTVVSIIPDQVICRRGVIPADRVVVCAGANTESLMGLGATTMYRNVRFTYALNTPAAHRLPSWIHDQSAGLPSFYALAPTPDTYSIGLSGFFRADTISEDEQLRSHQATITNIISQVFPGVNPTPIDHLTVVGYARPEQPIGYADTVSVMSNRVSGGHDGWSVIRDGNTVGIVGENLYKFAPHLGAMLANTIID